MIDRFMSKKNYFEWTKLCTSARGRWNVTILIWLFWRLFQFGKVTVRKLQVQPLNAHDFLPKWNSTRMAPRWWNGIRVCDWWFLNFKPQNMEPITFIWLGYKEIKTNCYHSVNVCISYISYFVKYSKLSKLSDELILNASLVQYLSVK